MQAKWIKFKTTQLTTIIGLNHDCQNSNKNKKEVAFH
jgi:hypothetical protein